MPDFNKGDKTQQGMSGNGWVWGQLEFNHKRDVLIAVTSNEEEEGLGGVYINVHDDLNNLDYTLSGGELPVGESVIGGLIPSGNINITSTEETNVSEYATAQVVDENLVAGNIKKDIDILGVTGTYEGVNSPISIATITVNNQSAADVTLQGALYNESLSMTAGANSIAPSTTDTVDICIGVSGGILNVMSIVIISITVSGDIEYVGGPYKVTGDCAITITDTPQ